MPDVEILQPELIDDDGNIRLHRREGSRFEIAFELPDGTPRDVSAALLFFEVKNEFRKPLESGTAIDNRTLIITREETAQLSTSTKGNPFVLIDETNVPPDVVWEGSIFVRGFVDQPELEV